MGGTMPVWGAVALAISVALITQFGAFIVQHKQRKHDRERRRNEEWHRNLRWAVDLISKGDETSELLGINALDALDDDEHLSTEDQRLIDAILTSILGEPWEDNGDNEDQDGYTDQNEGDGGDA